MHRILIVDDEQHMLNSIKRILMEFTNDYEIFTTTNSNEAPKLIEEFTIDLLVTDILIPEKDGLELITEVRQQYPALKIITMSGGGTTGRVNYLHTAKHLGSSYSLSKPFSSEELISAIKHVLGKSE